MATVREMCGDRDWAGLAWKPGKRQIHPKIYMELTHYMENPEIIMEEN